MGQNLSCTSGHDQELFAAVQHGDLELVEAVLDREPHLMIGKPSPLHYAASSGQVNVLSLLLDRGVYPDALNRHKQTPLMVAAMHGKACCIERLLQAGANVLMFDSLNGRTCLHYAANHGHEDCIRMILSAAYSTPVADSWGFLRFLNVRDSSGATPLHLAAQSRHPHVVRLLLESGALVSALTGGRGPGSTPLHFAARGGCLDCVRELLAWGADRIQRDSSGYVPYGIALKYGNTSCASILNPDAAEPLVWPSPWKFISELDPEARLLLEKALMVANQQREKSISSGAKSSVLSDADQDCNSQDDLSNASDREVCYICFDQLCTIKIQECGHQMCALCALTLCCYSKPNSSIPYSTPPACPFCRGTIARLVCAQPGRCKDTDSLKKKPNNCKILGEESSSFRGMSNKGSFGRLRGKSSGKIDSSSVWLEKP